MTRIAHISDPHFGTEQPPVVAALQEALRSLAPDLLVVSGDISQRARRRQFAAARGWLDRLELPWLAIPGNHDIPLFDLVTRFCKPYRLYDRFFPAREFFEIHHGIGFLGLDATGRFRHTRGWLDPAATEEKLAAARRQLGPDGLLFVVMHQPLSTAWTKDRAEALIDARTIDALFCRHRVDLVMSGHVHVPMLTASEKLFPQTLYSYVFSGAGTALSHRVRQGAPNSFNLIDTAADGIRLTEIAYAARQESFAARPSLHFAPSAVSGWTQVDQPSSAPNTPQSRPVDLR